MFADIYIYYISWDDADDADDEWYYIDPTSVPRVWKP